MNSQILLSNNLLQSIQWGGEVEFILYCHIGVLMWVLNEHIEYVTITTHIFMTESKIYNKSVNEKFTDYLSSDNQKK